MSRAPLLMLAVVLLSPVMLRAQIAATQPATGPSPHRIDVPSGFRQIVIGERKILCEPTDEPWVREILTELGPTTRPSPGPAELLERAAAHREAITAALVKSLALPDAAAVAPLFDERLVPPLRLLDEGLSRPPPNVTFLVASRERLMEIAKSGWTDGSIRYKDVDGGVVVVPQLGKVSSDALYGLAVQPALFDASDPPAVRRAALLHAVRVIEAYAARQAISDARREVEDAFLWFIWEVGYKPLGQKNEAAGWLGLGIAGFLTARHAAPILGETPEAMYARMSAQPPNEPICALGMDGMPAPIMREIWREQERRWAMSIVTEWTRRGGDDAIPKLIVALRKRQTPPPNRAALVRVIRESTGVDLTRDLAPKPLEPRLPPPPRR